jgi:magnesium transporter
MRRARRRARPGAPPGSVIVDPKAPKPRMRVIAYGPERYVEKEIADPDEVRTLLNQWPVCWINVDGLGDAELLQRLAEIVRLHPLALEDVVNLHQRAKVEAYGEQAFIVTHMVQLKEQLGIEQLSLYLGENFVVTFQQEPEWDCLGPVRERIRKGLSQVRQRGSGYLAYSLIDAVIDQYFPVLESYGERLEALEDQIVLRPTQRRTSELHELKRELLHLRRILWPLRDALNTLLRDPIPHIDAETRVYLRDCYDHMLRILDFVETDREVCSDLMDLYLTSISNRMNEVMKVLTVIATIFIPLTFIAGVYGMNFDTEVSPWNMPELKWEYGYPACLAVMLVIAVGLLVYFRRKGWIGSAEDRRAEGESRST